MSDDIDVLGGMITPPPPAGGGVPASFDTGVVTQVTDKNHVKVNLGDKEVTAFVPATLEGGPVVDAAVRISTQENTYTVESVISGAGAGGVPVGAVMMWMTATPPDGWLFLNGQTFSSATYPVLAAVLGTTTLPNAADRAPVGVSGTKTVKSTGGASSITLTEAQLPAHDHSMSHTHSISHTHEYWHRHGMQHVHAVYGYSGVDDNNFGGNNGRMQASDALTPFDQNTSNGSRDYTDGPTDVNNNADNTTDGANPSTSGSSSSSWTGTAGSGSSIAIQNPYLAFNFIIKAR